MKKQITIYLTEEEFIFLKNKENKQKYIRELIQENIKDEIPFLVKKLDILNKKQEVIEKEKQELIKKMEDLK